MPNDSSSGAAPLANASVRFFDQQFQRQIAAQALLLNPFEQAALPLLQGRVLDYGCGLGNLTLAAARQGCSVLALDASPAAIAHLQRQAAQQGLAIEAAVADLRHYRIETEFDAVVCIGLLMFFDCAGAEAQLQQLMQCLRPGGLLVLNVLTEGSSYLEMFAADSHCLFQAGALRERLQGWELLLDQVQDFPAPGDTVKRFLTLIARKPRALPMASAA